MDFAEKLAAAQAQPRPSKDVQVCLDPELTERRAALIAELKEARRADDADPRMGVITQTDRLEEQLAGIAEAARDAIVTLRFTRLPGGEWAALTSKHPVRVDVPLDKHYGYNYDAVCSAAAVASGARLEDDEPVAVTADEWLTLFDVLSGNEVAAIRDAIWSLNEYEPAQQLDGLVKGFGAAARSEKK